MMLGAIDRKFDSPFADKPHLRVDAMMRRTRISIRGQSCLLRCDMFAGCQLALHDRPHLCVIEVLHRQLSNAKVADCSESSRAARERTVVPAATNTGMRLQASLLVKDINHLVEKTFASFYDRQPVLSNHAGSLILGKP
jgi:hypothetical protein